MPELPEVETTRLGILPYTKGYTFKRMIVRNRSLRWPVPAGLEKRLKGQVVEGVARRGKYLLFQMNAGALMIHLGMSGSLRVVDCRENPKKHDHVDMIFNSNCALRYHDPRRFGSFHWVENPQTHPLLSSLGPEPFSKKFSGSHLFTQSRSRQISVKQFIMDGRVVVGVGNIYACEALFLSGVRPGCASNRISLKRYENLASAIKQVLESAIERGGTTLRDFVGATGSPGYFSLKLNVYGRRGEECRNCGSAIRSKILGQRSSFYCPKCQF